MEPESVIKEEKPGTVSEVKKTVWALAIDIETAGENPQHHGIIGIGAAIVSEEDHSIVEHFVAGNYAEQGPWNRSTDFDQRCKSEFWHMGDNQPDTEEEHEEASKKRKILDVLKRPGYKVSATSDETRMKENEGEHAMIYSLMVWRACMETLAKERKVTLMYCFDTIGFDCYWINYLINKYLPLSAKPMPYKAVDGRWGTSWETSSMMFGLIAQVDPDWVLEHQHGYGKKLAKHWVIPEFEVEHDHNPAHDAATIAFDFMVCRAIVRGEIPLRSED